MSRTDKKHDRKIRRRMEIERQKNKKAARKSRKEEIVEVPKMFDPYKFCRENGLKKSEIDLGLRSTVSEKQECNVEIEKPKHGFLKRLRLKVWFDIFDVLHALGIYK